MNTSPSTNKACTTRARARNGRFLPKNAIESMDYVEEAKVCGWCLTNNTTQWRFGPSGCSKRMMTLCNACGINYRRAVKNEGKFIDLDQLAKDTSCLRLSIQKSIKRQRNLKRAYLDVVRTPKFVYPKHATKTHQHPHSHPHSHSASAAPSRTRFRPTIQNLIL